MSIKKLIRLALLTLQMLSRLHSCLNKCFPDFSVSSISVTQCRFHYVSSVPGALNGAITSPQYPQPYPTSQVCKYTFHGQGRERVQLKFDNLDLYYPHDNPADPYE